MFFICVLMFVGCEKRHYKRRAPQELQSAHAFLMGVLQATDQTVEEDFKVARFLASERVRYDMSYRFI